MVGKGFDAASAGYLDASHFTREYKRLFGVAPMRASNGCAEAPG